MLQHVISHAETSLMVDTQFAGQAHFTYNQKGVDKPRNLEYNKYIE